MDYKGGNVVFIVGSGRSGTTWLQRLLASHPKVRTGQESNLFSQYIGPQLRNWHAEERTLAWNRGGIGMQCYFETYQFISILKEHMLKLMQPMIGQLREGEIFVEKSPDHSYWMSEISELLPDARFIHILRDGRDVAASFIAASKSHGAAWAPKSGRWAAMWWVQAVQAVQDGKKKIPRDKFAEVRYEQLRATPNNELRRLSDFMGLDWKDEDIERAVKSNEPNTFRETGAAIPLAGNFGKISGPVVKEPEGFVRRAKAGSWKQDLSTVQKVQVWIYARKTMREVGYSWTWPF